MDEGGDESREDEQWIWMPYISSPRQPFPSLGPLVHERCQELTPDTLPTRHANVSPLVVRVGEHNDILLALASVPTRRRREGR
jgi:hypothetical protein